MLCEINVHKVSARQCEFVKAIHLELAVLHPNYCHFLRGSIADKIEGKMCSSSRIKSHSAIKPFPQAIYTIFHSIYICVTFSLVYVLSNQKCTHFFYLVNVCFNPQRKKIRLNKNFYTITAIKFAKQKNAKIKQYFAKWEKTKKKI